MCIGTADAFTYAGKAVLLQASLKKPFVAAGAELLRPRENNMKTSSLALLLACLLATSVAALEIGDLPGKTFAARDSLGKVEDPSADARACLKGLRWPAADFQVQCESAAGKSGDVLVRFPSPIDTGDAVNDRVALEWYVARDEHRRPIKAPAVVVVHESGKGMEVGRLFARGLRTHGLHALMIQLPDYGERRVKGKGDNAAGMIVRMRQGIADVRRARDAAAVLPLVDADHIGLQGTSLGGFVAADAGALDDAYDGVFLMLAGGNLYDLVQNGHKDAAKARQKLADAGLAGDKLKSVLWQVEPTRIAHRLDPARTWLYSGKSDTVVPRENANALSAAARLDASHHIQMAANHYSGVVYVPMVLAHIRKHMAGGD